MGHGLCAMAQLGKSVLFVLHCRRISLAAPAILIQRHVRGFLVRLRVAEALNLSKQLRVFVTAMELAKEQGGSFLSPVPVFPDASDARQLMQK